jgi:hypothetical protein
MKLINKILSDLSYYYFDFPNQRLKQREGMIREFYDKKDIQDSLKDARKLDKIFSFSKNALNVLEGLSIASLIYNHYFDQTMTIIFCEIGRFALNKMQKSDQLFYNVIEGYRKEELDYQSLEEIAEGYDTKKSEEISGDGDEWKD